MSKLSPKSIRTSNSLLVLPWAFVLFSLGGCGGDSPVRTQPLEPAIPSPVARDSGAPFDERVRTIYNFKPFRTSKEDQKLKSAEMDALWETVDQDPSGYLPRLRHELRRGGQNRFFLYDGSQLLIKHSKAPEDLQLAAECQGQTDLEDVESEEFFRSTHRLAVWGANVWPCVKNILSEPKFNVFIFQHHLKLDQTGVVVYLLLPMKEELYVSALKARLKGEENRVVVKSLLAGLSMAVTEDAQAALSELVRDTSRWEFRDLAEPLTRLPSRRDFSAGEAKRELLFTFLRDLVARRYDNPAYNFEKFKKGAPGLIKKADLSQIRVLRRKHSERVSDEALEELEYLTLLMKVSLGSDE